MDDERSEAINEVVRKGLALLVGMAVVIALGTFVVVKALGLHNPGPDTTNPALVQPPSPLPSTALAVPGQSASPGGGSSATSSPSPRSKPVRVRVDRGLRLSASPAQVSAMGRINLTGTYGHRDNISLEVQRWQNGSWSDFPVSVTVSVGTFATYIRTGQAGVNKFRVFDPSADVGSNAVKVDVQ